MPIDDLQQARSDLEQFQRVAARIHEMRALLEAIEWSGDTVHHLCPSCGRMRMHGHDPDCALKRALDETPA